MIPGIAKQELGLCKGLEILEEIRGNCVGDSRYF